MRPVSRVAQLTPADGMFAMWWLPEWPCIGPEIERMECQRCQRLQDEIHALQEDVDRLTLQLQKSRAEANQGAIAVRANEQTIEQLRQDKAALQLNADMQITRDIGFDTRGLGS